MVKCGKGTLNTLVITGSTGCSGLTNWLISRSVTLQCRKHVLVLVTYLGRRCNFGRCSTPRRKRWLRKHDMMLLRTLLRKFSNSALFNDSVLSLVSMVMVNSKIAFGMTSLVTVRYLM